MSDNGTRPSVIPPSGHLHVPPLGNYLDLALHFGNLARERSKRLEERVIPFAPVPWLVSFAYSNPACRLCQIKLLLPHCRLFLFTLSQQRRPFPKPFSRPSLLSKARLCYGCLRHHCSLFLETAINRQINQGDGC